MLDDVYGKRKNIKDTQQKLETKIEHLQKEMEDIENQVVELEVEVGLGKRQRSTVDKIISRYETELELRHQEYENTEQKLDSLDEETKWVDWIEKYGEKLEMDTSTETKQRDFLKGLLQKVVVKSEFGYGRDKTKKVQRGHSLEFHYRMKIVGDDFQWTDKTKSPWVGHTTDGTNIDKSDPIRLVSPRTKKKEK